MSEEVWIDLCFQVWLQILDSIYVGRLDFVCFRFHVSGDLDGFVLSCLWRFGSNYMSIDTMEAPSG